MEAIDSSFALVMQGLLEQKQRLEELQQENEELRRQLTNLRAGHGIVVTILDQQFPLDATSSASEPPVASYQASTSQELEAPATETGLVIDAEQTTEELSPSPTFLKEMILEEMAAAATNEMSVWSEPVTSPQPLAKPLSEEEEKAVLRRELMGSFLLE